MEITLRAAQLNAQDIQVGDVIALQEIRLTATGIALASEPGGAVAIAEANGTVILTEASLNRFLAGRAEEPVRDLEVALLTGKVRISGRYRLPLGLGVPFTFTAVPEIEGGARLRLDPRQMSLVGAPLPGFSVQVIGEKINAQLAQGFDATRLPLPVRLTGLVVEPGRLLLSATAAIELHPAQTGIVKSAP